MPIMAALCSPYQFVCQHARRKTPQGLFIGPALGRLITRFIPWLRLRTENKDRAVSGHYPFGIGAFTAHKNRQPAGWNLAAPFGVGNGSLSDAEQIGKLGLRFCAGYALDALHLGIEDVIVHVNLGAAGPMSATYY